MNPSEFHQRYPTLQSPPPLSYLLGELKLPLVLGKTAIDWMNLPGQARGDQHPVLLLPGYGMHVRAMGIIKRYLTRLEFAPHDWSLGTNNGDMKGSLPLVQNDIDRIAQRTGQAPSLIGWSLGGTMARECARENPHSVRQIITLGSPVVGGPKFTAFKRLFEKRGFDLDRAANTVLTRYRKPLTTPVTALYCKRDSIVHWEACIDRFSDNVIHLEIQTPHMSMPFSAEVLRHVYDALANTKPETPAYRAQNTD